MSSWDFGIVRKRGRGKSVVEVVLCANRVILSLYGISVFVK